MGILLGLFGVFSGAVRYDVREGGREYTVGGLPFYAGTEGGCPDPFMVLGIQLNFLFWLLLPQFVLWVTSGRRRVQGTGSHDAAPPT